MLLPNETGNLFGDSCLVVSYPFFMVYKLFWANVTKKSCLTHQKTSDLKKIPHQALPDPPVELIINFMVTKLLVVALYFVITIALIRPLSLWLIGRG
jgi:hypothetical protein